MKKIGFFGGSFDPIHIGHLNLAIELKEKCKFDEILFCPCNVSPFKTENPPIASSSDRLNMLKLALSDISFFKYTDLEIKRGDVSFTINTLKELKNDENDIRLILTEETIKSFHLWKDYTEILKIFSPIIGSRNNILNSHENQYFTLSKENFVKTNIFEMSSSEIRERLKKRNVVNHLVLKEVLDYIYKNDLYL